MNGRQRIIAAAAGGQPARRWELDELGSGRSYETWMHTGGEYMIEVRYNQGGAVRCATLSAGPPRLKRPVATRHLYPHNHAKAERVIAWMADPVSPFVRPSGVRS